MNRRNSLRLIRRLGLALAVMAIAAPAAQAMPVIEQEGGTAPAPQQAFYPDDLHSSLPYASVQTVAPYDMIRSVSSGPTDSLGRPLTPPVPTDSLGRPLSPPDLVQPTSEVQSASDSSWFDPTHVGLGLFAIGLLLFGGAALIISRQNRRGRLAAA